MLSLDPGASGVTNPVSRTTVGPDSVVRQSQVMNSKYVLHAGFVKDL